MRVFAGALLAVLATGPVPGHGDLAVTLAAHASVRPCAVLTTATIVAYEAAAVRDVRYHFVRSDGTLSRTGRLALAGDGAVAQSVTDEWTPHGASPWVVLEIVAPEHVRSHRIAVAPRCSSRRILAESTR